MIPDLRRFADGGTPVCHAGVAALAAGLTKNKQGACQPLQAEVASDLRAYLAGRPEREPVWPGSWYEQPT